MNKSTISAVLVGALVVLSVGIGRRFYESVPAGHVAVATLFGAVKPNPYSEGLHLPVNPLYDFSIYDTREKTHLEQAQVPSQDQLLTRVDVSVQYNLIAEDAPRILQETGDLRDVLRVQIVPKLRSLIREQGKTVKRAEDFFLEETQEKLQSSILRSLKSYLKPKGVEVDAVLIRDIALPPFIAKAIEEKKEREQEVEKQKAELERFRTEQQQKIAQAQAERAAAEEEAEMVRVLADARAYEIRKINAAIGNNANYVKLQALKSLEAISTDPAAKIYFLNSDSPNPLPLMHLGEMPSR
jgi:regulator of protease activity HflC (stomatin/prohibitin superfamily)